MLADDRVMKLMTAKMHVILQHDTKDHNCDPGLRCDFQKKHQGAQSSRPLQAEQADESAAAGVLDGLEVESTFKSFLAKSIDLVRLLL